MNLDGRHFITIKETAAFLNCHVQTVYKMFYRAELPGVRVGRTVRIDFKRLLKRLNEQLEAQARGDCRGSK